MSHQNPTFEEAAREAAQKDTEDRLPYNKCPTELGTWLQRTAGLLFLMPFCGLLVLLLRLAGRYRIDRLRELRATYRKLVQDPRPLMICVNHLTFIDSALVIWALGSNFWYQFNYSKFSWNLPAGDFFKKKFSFRVIAYLTKCLFIHRDGTKRHQTAILELCMKLLKRGEVVTIFPEGKRSRSGRFDTDKLTFGVGKVLLNVPECRVLCVYIRGDQQEGYSNYPKKGSHFHVDFKTITPNTEQTGRQGYHELTMQVAREIKGMEDDYFKKIGRSA